MTLTNIESCINTIINQLKSKLNYIPFDSFMQNTAHRSFTITYPESVLISRDMFSASTVVVNNWNLSFIIMLSKDMSLLKYLREVNEVVNYVISQLRDSFTTTDNQLVFGTGSDVVCSITHDEESSNTFLEIPFILFVRYNSTDYE